jgi:outer membrane protein OmpA-like peptidoglycan-associated protein
MTTRATIRTLLIVGGALMTWAATPARAGAQDVFKRIKDQTAKRLQERRAKIDSTMMKTAGTTVDSALAKSGRGADAVVIKAGDVANSAIATTERGVKSIIGGSDPVLDVASRLAGGRAVFEEIRFAEGSDQIDPASAAVLKQLAAALAAAPGPFLIEAHTEAVPPPGDAQSLSQRRASAVKAQLAANGAPADRLLAIGYGATRPNANDPKANARIEIARAQ